MKKNNLNYTIEELEKYIINPKKSLPEKVFLFLTRNTPMINADLLIKNSKGQTLLTWREKGEKYPSGWHVPGGIIRFKEKIKKRIRLTALNEIGCEVEYENNPMCIREIDLNQRNRSHFISILYKCRLKRKPNPKLKYSRGIPKLGQWKWFSSSPKNLIYPHKEYKKFINRNEN